MEVRKVEFDMVEQAEDFVQTVWEGQGWNMKTDDCLVFISCEEEINWDVVVEFAARSSGGYIDQEDATEEEYDALDEELEVCR